MKIKCQRCREVVSRDMKYACPEGAACPVFGRGEATSLSSLLGDEAEVGITGSLEDEWIEGSWKEAGAYWDPVFPADALDHLWLWTESMWRRERPERFEPVATSKAKTELRVYDLVFRSRNGRSPRWFWRPIPPVEPPNLG